ncbi:MAG: hypothetical protein CMB80_03260 [Flammeovirgaceae bacterium]|nr:hypothetical protein [Flammeovirgaceae bacterium]|tara:strand:+ start:31 stop:285 length:255 start_codon:yes stop_codon:yes gene_type:complete
MKYQYKTKWKVGDLVTLSSAGLKIGQNSALVAPFGKVKGFGVVTEIGQDTLRWPISVMWMGAREDGRPHYTNFKEYELKKMKHQ